VHYNSDVCTEDVKIGDHYVCQWKTSSVFIDVEVVMVVTVLKPRASHMLSAPYHLAIAQHLKYYLIATLLVVYAILIIVLYFQTFFLLILVGNINTKPQILLAFMLLGMYTREISTIVWNNASYSKSAHVAGMCDVNVSVSQEEMRTRLGKKQFIIVTAPERGVQHATQIVE
jgi:hypothetical protein